eukprot:TRINITY_DN8740_c0_g1_i1.p1 TRINITY_DN8740_c0_g1~~TRINITY_DN8740_c0_g1_i1.p1  ORF type:complete len:886 (-),score=226.32 TRINITY_DN8740_c0_g1_i1:268-2925(-)
MSTPSDKRQFGRLLTGSNSRRASWSCTTTASREKPLASSLQTRQKAARNDASSPVQSDVSPLATGGVLGERRFKMRVMEFMVRKEEVRRWLEKALRLPVQADLAEHLKDGIILSLLGVLLKEQQEQALLAAQEAEATRNVLSGEDGVGETGTGLTVGIHADGPLLSASGLPKVPSPSRVSKLSRTTSTRQLRARSSSTPNSSAPPRLRRTVSTWNTFQRMDLVSGFLTEVKRTLPSLCLSGKGVSLLFAPPDLVEGRNVVQVVTAMRAVAREACRRFNTLAERCPFEELSVVDAMSLQDRYEDDLREAEAAEKEADEQGEAATAKSKKKKDRKKAEKKEKEKRKEEKKKDGRDKNDDGDGNGSSLQWFDPYHLATGMAVSYPGCELQGAVVAHYRSFRVYAAQEMGKGTAELKAADRFRRVVASERSGSNEHGDHVEQLAELQRQLHECEEEAKGLRAEYETKVERRRTIARKEAKEHAVAMEGARSEVEALRVEVEEERERARLRGEQLVTAQDQLKKVIREAEEVKDAAAAVVAANEANEGTRWEEVKVLQNRLADVEREKERIAEGFEKQVEEATARWEEEVAVLRRDLAKAGREKEEALKGPKERREKEKRKLVDEVEQLRECLRAAEATATQTERECEKASEVARSWEDKSTEWQDRAERAEYESANNVDRKKKLWVEVDEWKDRASHLKTCLTHAKESSAAASAESLLAVRAEADATLMAEQARCKSLEQQLSDAISREEQATTREAALRTKTSEESLAQSRMVEQLRRQMEMEVAALNLAKDTAEAKATDLTKGMSKLQCQFEGATKEIKELKAALSRAARIGVSGAAMPSGIGGLTSLLRSSPGGGGMTSMPSWERGNTMAGCKFILGDDGARRGDL